MTNEQNKQVTQTMIRSLFQFRRNAWLTYSVPGLKPSEVRLLFSIKRGANPETGMIKVSEIGKLMHVTSPTITQLVNGLEKRGLLERQIDDSDRRVVNIRLTSSGEDVTKQAYEAFAASTSGLVDFLGEEQSLQLIELLNLVNQYFKEKQNQLDQTTEWGDPR